MPKTSLFALLLCPVLLASAPAFSAEPEGDAPQLAGKSFMWTGGLSKDCELPPVIEFASSGAVSGSAGCNSLTGEWKLEGKKLQLGALGVTGRMCGKAFMELEKKFLQGINAAVYATAEGDAVNLWNEAGGLVMKLVPEAPGACG